MTWATFDIWGDDEANGPEQVHVIPTYEDHEVSADCWCEPRETDDGVFVHRDALDRDPPASPDNPKGGVMSEFRVVEANGQPYPPHSQPLRSLDAALRRREFYEQVESVSGEARMPVGPLRIERRSMVVSMWEPWNVGALRPRSSEPR